jgi:hypothetical protein
MSKGPSTFRKADIKRGVEALKSAGLKVARVEVDKAGKLVFISADATEDETGSEKTEGIVL